MGTVPSRRRPSPQKMAPQLGSSRQERSPRNRSPRNLRVSTAPHTPRPAPPLKDRSTAERLVAQASGLAAMKSLRSKVVKSGKTVKWKDAVATDIPKKVHEF